MITIKDCRNLLDIQSRDTINEDLKALGWFGRQELNWQQVKRLLEMRLFLGLKPGVHSRDQFLDISPEKLPQLFQRHGIDIDTRFKQIQSQYQPKHRVTVQLVLDR